MNDRSIQKTNMVTLKSELDLFKDYEHALHTAKMNQMEGYIDQMEQECNEMKDDCSSIRSQNTEFFEKMVDNARAKTIEDQFSTTHRPSFYNAS